MEAHGPMAIRMRMFATGCLVTAYIAVSTGLISLNKFIMTPGRFPFSICLVLMHMASSSIVSAVLYAVKPELFPALSDPTRRVELDVKRFFKAFLPISILFAGSLVLSNTAYLFATVAFLQMLKEGNIIMVYLFSLVVALERFSTRNMGILLSILGATLLTVKGEVHFSLLALFVQGSAMFCECWKIVLQAKILTGTKFDPLTYTLLVSPVCTVFLGSLVLGLSHIMPGSVFSIPTWADFAKWWPYIFASCGVAVLLNIIVAFCIQMAGGVGMILAGIAKDAVIVLASVAVVGEIVTEQQFVGFGLQLGLILLWSMQRTFPKEFEDGILSGLSRLLLPKGEQAVLVGTSSKV